LEGDEQGDAGYDSPSRTNAPPQILYDLPQLPSESLAPLRDSLIDSLAPLTQPGAPAGSRAVLVQLCLALSDLALQMPSWTNVVGGFVERFGKDPATVNVLLGFLKVLVEESGNARLPISVSAVGMVWVEAS
jgi:transportin-3